MTKKQYYKVTVDGEREGTGARLTSGKRNLTAEETEETLKTFFKHNTTKKFHVEKTKMRKIS